MDVREKLVELLHTGVRCPGVIDNCNDCPHHSLEKPCDEFGATVDMLVANGVTVQEWISIKDGLPKNGKEGVLIALLWGGVDIGWCEDGRWRSEFVNEYEDGEVTHWMPLPNPPKGE